MIAAFALLLLLQAPSTLREHVEAGLRAKAAGQFDNAIREFKQVAELAPNLAAAHVNLGAVYFDMADYGNAIPSLKRAVELDPQLVGAHSMLGAALLAQGFAANAVPHLEKAQAEDLLGVALLESDKPREALDRLEAALLKRPDDPDLLYYLSHAHARLARRTVEKLQSMDSPRAQQIRAEGLAAAGKRDLGIDRFRSALASRPGLRGVHYALGDLYRLAGDYIKAEAEFRAETRLTPGSAGAAYKLGSVLLHLGQLTEAMSELKRANVLQPGMPETLLELGKAMNAAMNPTAAVDYLKQMLEAEPGGSLAETAHFQLAQAYRKLGNTVEAGNHLKRFQELRAASK